ncbi:MAG: hypothetical protein E2604_00350 [Flavobacterium sp.]|nr:hypothetical protein [Flavobacterium sp.]
MKIIQTLFISLFLTSCHKSEQHSIEIYLLKDRLNTDEGVSLEKIKDFPEMDSTALKEMPKTVRYDTLNKEFIYAGSFHANKNQVEPTPLIKNEDVLGLDVENSEIKLSAESANKIIALKPSMKDGIQFVITDNKNPVMTGYFWSSYSSYGSTWNNIEYDHTKKVDKPIFLRMYKGHGINAAKREAIPFSDFKDLVNAFSQSDRLLNSIPKTKNE